MLKNLRFSVILGVFLGLSTLTLAQTGTVRGVVYDGSTGEPLIGAFVKVQDNSSGGSTDLEGNFSLTLAPGTYSIIISFVTFQTVTISEVIVKAGETTVLDNISLKEDAAMLDEVVISSQALRTSESAIVKIKRNSPMLVDGISSAKFRQTGDSDASQAIKRVTGVSVEGGKYVFVRGLGDRYTKTTLNNVDIPGLDPDRNSIQIDIFPTNLIDNLVIQKTATADMPADFTGGSINIETKDFPEEKVFNISMGMSYNPAMHFNKDYFIGDGGKTDWLGFDDGTRELPSHAPDGGAITDQERSSFLRSLNKNLSGKSETSFADFSFGLSLGNQKNFANGNSLGYVFSTSYKNATLFYDDVVYGEYQRPVPSDEYELVDATVGRGSQAERSVLLGTLGGLAFKTSKSKYKITILHLQNGEEKAAKLSLVDNEYAVGNSGFLGSSDNIEYSQRSVTNVLLGGEHHNEKNTFSVDWKISPTLSKITDPDIRKTAFTYTSSDTVLSPGAAGYPFRVWRYLDEINVVGKLDFKADHTLFGKNAVLRFGASQVYKERDFEILSYNMQFNGSVPDFDGNPENIMKEEYLFPNGPVDFGSGNADPNPNSFNSTVTNTALYLSEQFQIKKLKTVIGVRAEKFIQRYTGSDALGENVLDNEEVLNGLDLFPSANLIYALTETQNLRFSYSRTIARPSFKELSYAQIIDPITERIFNGGLNKYPDWDGNLRETNINNFDLRWELFMPGGQLLSVSGFYKTFLRPIELVRIPTAQTTNEFQPRNVGDGSIIGVELEARKSLAFIFPNFQNFFVSGNLTVVKSAIEMTDLEFNSRKGYQKSGETIDRTRDMAGQAPYIINVGLSYEDVDRGWDGGIFYNVSGPTLTVVGGGLYPDVYAEPFHSLNFNLNKEFGKNRRTAVTISVSNILGDVRESVFTGYKADDQYYTRLDPGTSFSVGLKYNLAN
jgi:outer membrane receptor protein involved in Fe transport